jgi:hypothetical protein
MAITRRTTTVTEHFGSSTDSAEPTSTQAPTAGNSNFDSIKNNFSATQTSADLNESPDAHNEINNLSSGVDVERFSNELNIWLGQHTIKIVLSILGLAAAIFVGLWAIASKVGKAESQFETIENSVKELKTDNKLSTERLLKLEIKLDRSSKK